MKSNRSTPKEHRITLEPDGKRGSDVARRNPLVVVSTGKPEGEGGSTHQNDSNFLTHGLWSKTKLCMQHIHLEIL
jgi:hypothetical protein